MEKLSRTHRRLHEDYLIRQTKIGGSIGHVKKRIGYEAIRAEGTAPPFAFRINAPPIFHLYMDHAVSRFRRLSREYFENLGIFVERGYLPCYCPTFDVFSMVHLYGERSGIAERDSPLSPDAWEVSEGRGTRATFSSINSFLVQKDYVTETPTSLTELLKQYLNQFFWSYPCKGFTCSPQIVPDENRIRFIYKTTKTLFSFQGMVKKELYTTGRNYEFTAAKLRGLVCESDSFGIREFTAICLPETASELRSIKKKYAINGIVTEFIRPNLDPFYTLTRVSDFVDTYPNLLASVFGMVASRAFYSNDSVSIAGDTEDLKQEAENLIDMFGNEMSLPRTVSSGIKDPWNWAIDLLFPVFTTDSHQTLCMHPLFASSLGMLKSTGVDVYSPEARSLLLNAVRLASDSDERFSSIKEVKALEKLGVPVSNLGAVVSTVQSYMPFVKALKKYY